jgi:7-cyano-7-deazaguanine synthase in queuosine biosynthesis
MKLLNYSGGIDSLYCLLNCDYDIVHHCSIINHEGRHRLEKSSVDATLRLIRLARPQKPFEFVQTVYDYGNTKRIVLDKDVIGFQTGMLMRAYPIDTVIISSNKEDVSKVDYYTRTEARRLEIIKAVSGSEPKLELPIAQLSKRELIESIPEKYLRLAWFCRRPKRDKPCGNCPTCKAVLPHLNNKK